MNRTIKEATVQRYHYDSHAQLAQHLSDFGCRPKTLKGLTPYEFICKAWTAQPERFTLNPLQQMPGLNSRRVRRRGGARGAGMGGAVRAHRSRGS